MSSFLSKINPTTKSLQKEYVEKRQRALYANDPAKTERVRKKVEAVMARNSVQGDWHEVYLKIHRALQSRDLTINVEAGNWFRADNKYDTYTQMYERAVRPGGKMVLTDNDPKNPAVPRMMADDLVTIPDEWANAHPFSQRKRLHKALNASGVSMKKLAETKSTLADPKNAKKITGDSASGYQTKNKDFNPEAKQVFAALNYGGRLHGSCTYYGFSHLILTPALKTNAFYYPEDTFFLASRSGTASQAGFNTIGALMEHAAPSMMQALWDSCYRNLVLPDTNDANDLVEAHIFKRLKIAEDVQALVLSRMRKGSDPAWTDTEWENIVTNARNWCKRNSVRLVFASP
ncbi:hypothetical protein [Povalibacter sp.]|uniref:hypothetical protein n=1 Tax=Povalibacter sp. TaxID=1962978 RepID=UPI002F401377